MRRFLALALLLITSAVQAAWVPTDIAAYVQRRTQCNHWAGEEPYDQARRGQIARAMTKLHCTGLDADEKKLRRRYAHAPAQLQQIDAAKDAL